MTLTPREKLLQAAADKWVPCPDHRDKVNDGCYVCKNEALEARIAKLENSPEMKFVRHIESHLRRGQVPICKICGLAIDEIAGLKPKENEEEGI